MLLIFINWCFWYVLSDWKVFWGFEQVVLYFKFGLLGRFVEHSWKHEKSVQADDSASIHDLLNMFFLLNFLTEYEHDVLNDKWYLLSITQKVSS